MRLELLHLVGKLFQERNGGGIKNAVDGVEAQSVKMIIPQPHQGIVTKKAAHLPAIRAVEVKALAPRG